VTIGYYEIANNWIYGNPDNSTSPEQIFDLQERYRLMNFARAQEPGWVPQSELLQTPWNPLSETPAGPVYGNQPIPGWTCQNSTGSPFRDLPTPTLRGIDWTSDVNPIGAGAYDQNQAVAVWAVNPLNQAPYGETELFNGAPNDGTNPNAPPYDVGGTLDPLEY
jgi:hypothetical protein